MIRRRPSKRPWLVALVWLWSATVSPAWAEGGVTIAHRPPASIAAGAPFTVFGRVSAASKVAWATLVYRCGGAWQWAELKRSGADLYETTIPGAALTPGALEYYFEGLDDFGETLTLLGTKGEPVRVPVREPGAAAVPESVAEAEPAPVGPVGEEPPDAQARPAARIEQWDPDGSPAPSPPPSGAKDALADSLSMFGADDEVSVASLHRQSVSDAPAIVSVITAEQFRSLGLRRLVDLAKVIPGFETSRDVQGFWRVGVGGRRSDPELLVLWDGLRMNNPYDGRAIWEQPLDDVERVEVIRGPGGGLYGAGAFSGVINLVPRKDAGVAVRGSFGSFGALEAAARFGHVGERLRLFGSADLATRDGYQRPIAKDMLSTNPDVIAGVTDDHRTGFGGRLRAEFAFDPDVLVFGSLRLTRERRGALVGYADVVGAGSDLGWLQLLGDLGVDAKAAGWQLRARLYTDLNQTERTFVLFPVGYQRRVGQLVTYDNGILQQTAADLLSLGAEASAIRELFAGNTLSLGAQLERQRLSPFSYRTNLNDELPTSNGQLTDPAGVTFPQRDPDNAARLVAGVYAQDEWRLAEALRLTAGARFDYVQYGRVVSSTNVGQDLSALAVNPRLGLVWRPSEPFAFKALFARAIRAPTFDEFLSIVAMPPSLNNGTFVKGWNPDDPLDPVTVTSFGLGGEAVTPLEGGRALVRVNGFWNQFDHPIEPVDKTGVLQLENRPKGVRILGLEAEGHYEISRRAGTFVNVSWFRARDLATDEATPDFSLLTDLPQLRANWGVTVPVGSLGALTLLAQFGSERRNNARTQLEATRRYRIPAYGLLSANFRTRPIFDRFELVAAVANLTDLDYRDDVPRPDASRLPGLLPREGVNGSVSLGANF